MQWTPKKLALAFVLFVGVSAIIGIVAWSFIDGGVVPPNPPAGVRIFARTKQISINGRDPAEWKKGYQVKQFVRLASGDVVAPILKVERPRFTGFMGAVRTELVRKSFVT